MIIYKEYAKQVFDWLLSKHKIDPNFTFFVRQKANKGAELNYFIGTEKSKYFSTTFWNIPVNYPGSSSDLINLVFQMDSNKNFVYTIQFNQTRSPESKQNEWALQLIQNCKKTLKSKFDRFTESDEINKMEFYKISGKSGYNSIDELIVDVNTDIEMIIPIVNAEIKNLKEQNPAYKAHRFTPQEQKNMLDKMAKRFKDYENIENPLILIDDTEDEGSQISNYNSNIPLNQILYGPPGTGKTYATKELAVKIANPSFIIDTTWTNDQKRQEIIKEYDVLYQSGQIVFTTFHQSMSYEDFIEGIKPETKDNQVTYDVKEGIFKRLSTTAENNWIDATAGNAKQLSFDAAFSLLKEEWDENEDLKFPLKREGNDYTIIGFTKTSIQFKKASGGTSHTLSIATLRDQYYKLKEVRSTGVGIYYPSILSKLNQYQPTQIVDKKVKSYVLIIDEINRGNVSAIFGELITLLEEDKRIGRKEELRVKLPYSKDEDFGVPQNLYIIGTMNTADRSVEALDTALRRRFSFTEVMPDLTVLETVEYKDFKRLEIMSRMNNRLEILLDRNHTLGHAYFMKEDFKKSFQNEIIPLLQEYFYNDCSKIGLILGKGFVREKLIKGVKIDKSLLADFDSKDEIDILKNYELIPFSEITDIEAAFNILLS